MPDDDAQVDAERDQAEQYEPETKSGALGLLTTVPVDAASGSMYLIRTLNNVRVELERLVDDFRATSRLGHTQSINGSAARNRQ